MRALHVCATGTEKIFERLENVPKSYVKSHFCLTMPERDEAQSSFSCSPFAAAAKISYE